MYTQTAEKYVRAQERMKIKLRSLSLRRGVRNDSTIFVVGGNTFLSEQPIKSLGRWYTTEISDKQTGRTLMSKGLVKIDQSQLLWKYKVWCYEFTLYKRVMWPLKISKIISTRSKMDGKAYSFIRKWLGLLRCLSETGLFGKNTLQLPSISLGYKQENTRLEVSN